MEKNSHLQLYLTREIQVQSSTGICAVSVGEGVQRFGCSLGAGGDVGPGETPLGSSSAWGLGPNAGHRLVVCKPGDSESQMLGLQWGPSVFRICARVKLVSFPRGDENRSTRALLCPCLCRDPRQTCPVLPAFCN